MDGTSTKLMKKEREQKGLARSRSLENVGSLSFLTLGDSVEERQHVLDGTDTYEDAKKAWYGQDPLFGSKIYQRPFFELTLGRNKLVCPSHELCSSGLTRSSSQILPVVSGYRSNWTGAPEVDYRRLLANIKRRVDADLGTFEQVCEHAKSNLKDDDQEERKIYVTLIQVSSSIRNFRVVSVDLVTVVRFFKERILCLERLRQETTKLQWSQNQFNISPVIKLLFILSKISCVLEEVEFEISEVEDYMTELTGNSLSTSDFSLSTQLQYQNSSTTCLSRSNLQKPFAILEDVSEEQPWQSSESSGQQYPSSSVERTTPEELELCRICERYFSLSTFEQHTIACAAEARFWMKYEDVNKRLRTLLSSLNEKVAHSVFSLTQVEKEILFKFVANLSSVCILLTGLESSCTKLERTLAMSETDIDANGSEMLQVYRNTYRLFFPCYESSLLDRDGCIIEHGLKLNESLKNSLKGFAGDLRSFLDEILDAIQEALELRCSVKDSHVEHDSVQDSCSTDGSECGSSVISTLTDVCSEDSREDLFPKKIGKYEENLYKSLLKKLSLKCSTGSENDSCSETVENVSNEVSNSFRPCDKFAGDSSSFGTVPSINDFYILKAISRGAFGRVYLVRKKKTGDIYALKAISKSEMIRKNLVNQVLAERDILAGVHTSFVVKFFWSFETNDKFFIVMEYVPGGDFYSLLRNVGYLEEPVVKQYLAETVLALEELHNVGVIHRDLKPDNMLITKEGHLKLTDFGLSRLGLLEGSSNIGVRNPFSNVHVVKDSNQYNLTSEMDNGKAAQPVGTPDYLAPEILLGAGHSFTVDWWCLGIVGYELLVGYPPFHDATPSKIFANILNHRLTWPELPISDTMKDFIKRLLDPDPLQRLGAKGPAEVKQHPIFADIDWENILERDSCFKPQCDSEDDTSYFVSPKPFVSFYSTEYRGNSTNVSQDPASKNSAILQSIISKERAAYMNSFVSETQMDFACRDLDNLEAMNMQVLRERVKSHGTTE